MNAIRHEHEGEPEHGLPERLPEGESVLWQGAPDWRELALRAFHLRKLAIYFGLILALHVATRLGSGDTLRQAAVSALWLVPLALAALALVATMAWLSARSTVYTVTDRRVVMRIGIVLTITFNLPYRAIGSAGLALHARGCGDIPLALAGGDRIAYLQLWPHARPWCVRNPEPMLRAVPHAAEVARILAQAWGRANQVVLAPLAAPAVRQPDGPLRPIAAA